MPLVLEATTTAWQVHDLLVPPVASVTVAHPLMVKLIAAARVKTDRRDTINLAKLLAANLIPVVWVPPIAVRKLRELVAHRRRLVQQRTQLRNRLRSLLHRHRLVPPTADPLCGQSTSVVAGGTAFRSGAARRAAGSAPARPADPVDRCGRSRARAAQRG